MLAWLAVHHLLVLLLLRTARGYEFLTVDLLVSIMSALVVLVSWLEAIRLRLVSALDLVSVRSADIVATLLILIRR